MLSVLDACTLSCARSAVNKITTKVKDFQTQKFESDAQQRLLRFFSAHGERDFAELRVGKLGPVCASYVC